MTKKLLNPNEPATSRQTYAIYLAGRVDVRPLNLTRKQASDLLDKLNEQNGFKTRMTELKVAELVAQQGVNREDYDWDEL